MNEQRHKDITARGLLRLLLLLLMIAGASGAWGTTLYQQNYNWETNAGSWRSQNASDHLSLVTGDATYGKYIRFSFAEDNTSNSRTAYTYFYTVGSDIYGTVTSYTLEFDVQFNAVGNNQESQLAILPDGVNSVQNAHISSNDYLFALSWGASSTALNANGTSTGNSFTTGHWNHIKLDIDNTAGKVTYKVTDKDNSNSTLASGTRGIPSGMSYKAYGIHFCSGRYGAITYFDNVHIYTVDGNYSYTVRSSLGTLLASGTVASRNQIECFYPQFELQGSTLYEAKSSYIASTWNYFYKYRGTVDSEGKEFVIENEESSISNVVFYSEAEELSGVSTATNDQRASKGKMGYTTNADTYLPVTILYPGQYKIAAKLIHANDATKTVNFKVAETTVYTKTVSKSDYTIYTSGVYFTVPSYSTLYFASDGASNGGVDLFYIQGQDISFPVSSGDISLYGSIEDIVVYNASASTTYTSSNPNILVTNNGDGTITLTCAAGAEIDETATITATENGKTATYTATVVTGTLSFAESSKTAYIEDLTFSYAATSSSNAEITYSASSDVAKVEGTSSTLRLVKPGSVTVTATDARGLSTSYELTVMTRNSLFSPLSGTTYETTAGTTTFDVGTTLGQIIAETIKIDDITMSFGSTSEVQVVRRINNSYAATCPDVNGYAWGNIIGENVYGSLYIFKPTASKYLTVTGYFSDTYSNAVLVNAETPGTVIETVRNTGTSLASYSFPQKLEAGETYYFYAPWYTTFALKSFSYTDSYEALTLDYPRATANSTIVFPDEELEPTLTLTIDGVENTNWSDFYTATYSLADEKNITRTLDTSTGALTIGTIANNAAQGYATIKVDLEPNTAGLEEEYAPVHAEYTVFATDGRWDIQGEYTSVSKGNELSDDQWEQESGKNYKENKLTSSGWDYIYDSSDGLFDVTYGLLTNGNFTFYSNTHLLKAFAGGKVAVPGIDGWVLTVRAASNGNLVPIGISNVQNIDGTPASQEFIVNTSLAEYQFLCEDDGWIILSNNNANLQNDFYYISLEKEIVLKDGETTYVEYTGNTGYQVNVLNSKSSTFSYAITSGSGLVTQTNFATTGKIDSFTGTGTVNVTVTATDGTLKGAVKNLTIYIIDMSVSPSTENATLATDRSGVTFDDHPAYQTDLKQFVTITGGNDAMKQDLKFYEYSKTKSSTTTSISKESSGNWRFNAVGTGSVVVAAQLGTIVKYFTVAIKGVEFAAMNPVIPCSSESYTAALETSIIPGTYDAITYSINTADVKGNINASSLSINTSTGEITNIVADNTATASTTTETGKSKGGTIPVTATLTNYNNTGEALTIETVITVAYTNNTWDFFCYDDKVFENMSGVRTTLEKKNWSSRQAGDGGDKTGKDWLFDYPAGGNSHGTVYYYNHAVNGDNSLVIGETAGLYIESDDSSFGVDGQGDTTQPRGNGYGNIAAGEETTHGRYIMMKKGSKLTIPQLKPGQWIDICWRRHQSDQGERWLCTNLLDVTGTPITELYKIGSTQDGSDHLDCGRFSFKVAGEIGGAPVDVSLESNDPSWTRIYRIEVFDRMDANNNLDTTYVSTMVDKLKASSPNVDVKSPDKTIEYQYLSSSSTREEQISHCFQQHTPNALISYTFQKDATLTASLTGSDRVLNEKHWPTEENGSSDVPPSFTYSEGWGKAYITTSAWTSDGRYVANRGTWTVTVGKSPAQSYPYTWDFTKYFTNTQPRLNTSDGYDRQAVTVTAGNKQSRVTQTWHASSNQETIIADGYNANEYASYYVDGAQLVSTATGILPETAGLGFSCNGGTGSLTLDMQSTSTTKVSRLVLNGQEVSDPYGYFTHDTNGKFSFNSKFSGATYDGITFTSGLKLEQSTKVLFTTTAVSTVTIVQSTWNENPIKFDETDYAVATATTGTGYRVYTISNVAAGSHTIGRSGGESGIFMVKVVERSSGASARSDVPMQKVASTSTKSGKLTLTGGGTITVPTPGTSYSDYYIYFTSDVAPSSMTNATTTDARTDVSTEGTLKQYCYKFTSDADATFTFSGDANIYAIAVTNILKTLTKVSGDGWATESRDVNIDHTLTGYLTTNDVDAYVVNNDTYTDNKAVVSMEAVNEDGYVPANRGIVLRQESITATGDTYDVPLFVPAVTTAETTTSTSFGTTNKMYPNVTATLHNSETQTIETTDYTKFVLAKKYMTWAKSSDGTLVKPTDFESKDVAVFYRLHIYSDGSEGIASGLLDAENTMAANKAYLLLETSKINPAIWASGSPSRRYIGIQGVSDMDEEEQWSDGEQAVPGDGRTYNLRGQAVDGEGKLRPGLYIRGGKKVVVK